MSEDDPSFRGRPHSQYTAQEATRLVPAGPNLVLQSQADARIRTGDPFITSEVLWPAELRRRGAGKCSRVPMAFSELNLDEILIPGTASLSEPPRYSN